MTRFDHPTRRDFLWKTGGGLGGIALASMLGRDPLLASAPPAGGILHAPHQPAKARRVVQLFMAGAASHIDLFDFKPDMKLCWSARGQSRRGLHCPTRQTHLLEAHHLLDSARDRCERPHRDHPVAV